VLKYQLIPTKTVGKTFRKMRTTDRQNDRMTNP